VFVLSIGVGQWELGPSSDLISSVEDQIVVFRWVHYMFLSRPILGRDFEGSLGQILWKCIPTTKYLESRFPPIQDRFGAGSFHVPVWPHGQCPKTDKARPVGRLPSPQLYFAARRSTSFAPTTSGRNNSITLQCQTRRLWLCG